MAKKSHLIIFTIIYASFIIEYISTKHVKKTSRLGKNNVRLNSKSMDEGINFSQGDDDKASVSSSQEENNSNNDENNLNTQTTTDLLELNDVTHTKTTMSSRAIKGFSLTDAEVEKFKIWSDGVIPYYIDVNSFSDKVLRDKIRSFLNSVNSLTSLKFVEYPSPPEDDDTRWVFFLNRRGLLGCADHSVWNFTTKGVQRVVLGYDCMNKEGELPEAVLSIVGVPAQHTAPDRDKYIKVNIENAIPEKRKLFDKLPDGDWLFHNLPYDYNSAGHYHNFKYSENGHTVIEPLDRDVTIGETKVLSTIDIQKIKLLYDYITKMKSLDAPECEKLFKVGKRIKSYKPKDIIMKPNRKPIKYQPVPQSAIDYFEDHKNNLIKEVTSEILLSHWPKTTIKLPIMVKQTDKPDVPSDSSDNKNDIKQLKAKLHYDPLTYLSDDTSGDDTSKLNKIKQGKFETLKAIGGH